MHPLRIRDKKAIVHLLLLVLSITARILSCDGLALSDSTGLNPIGNINPPQPEPWMARRSFLSVPLALQLWSHHPMAVMSLTDTDGDQESTMQRRLEQQCQDGALSAEQAIPGAYSQACMNLPIRDIPVRRRDGTVVTLRIQQQPAAAGSTGTAVWNSALLLTRLLEQVTALESKANENSWWQDKKVVELGCGTAVASLAASVLGASKVMATDGNPTVLDLAQRNVEMNGLSDKVSTQLLPWGLMEAMDLVDSADVILGADLTYSPGSWRQLAESTETVLAPDGLVIYLSLGHAGFNVNAEMDGFLSVAKELGLECLQPSSPYWPFPSISKSLSTLIQETMTMDDRQVIQGTGGVRVEVLRKRRSRRQRGI